MRERGSGHHQVLDAVALVAVVLPPRHLPGVLAEVGAADAVMYAHRCAAAIAYYQMKPSPIREVSAAR